jgi:hypothetical protein
MCYVAGVKRILGVALTACCALTFLGSTCDLKSDECNYTDPASAYCTADNVAVVCNKPGEEVHAREDRTPCPADTQCTLTGVHSPVCARKPSPPCDGGDTMCDDAGIVSSKCATTFDGGSAWIDDNCAIRVGPDSTYTGKCVQTADTHGISKCGTNP